MSEYNPGEWIFTFGSNQAHPNGYVIVKADNFSLARKEMVRLFGLCWSMQYDSPEAAGVDEYKLRLMGTYIAEPLEVNK